LWSSSFYIILLFDNISKNPSFSNKKLFSIQTKGLVFSWLSLLDTFGTFDINYNNKKKVYQKLEKVTELLG